MDLKISKNLKDFDLVYQDMCEQFPKNELKSKTQYLKLFENSNYKLILASDVGYILFMEDKELNTIWIDYFAIFKKYHSQGYGSKILNTMKKLNYRGCFLEVEKIDKNKIQTIRRVNFYKNANAKLLDTDYYYPHSEGILAMDLYYIPFSNPHLPGNKEIEQSVKKLFSTIHKDIKTMPEALNKFKIICR